MRLSSDARRRAATLVLVALVVATTCVLLGRWQWDKHVHRDAANATIGANWSAAPVPLDSLVAAPDQQPVAGDEWRSVAVTGHYLADAGVLLRNRPVAGHPAYHVLVPFQVDGGAVLVVDRGWVALGDSGTSSAAVPPPPAGSVDLVARLRVPEPPSDRAAPAGQVQNLDPGQVLVAGGLPAGTATYRWYAESVTESPAAATALGPLDAPATDPGPYLSYAVQWWLFAAAGLFAFGWMARREVLDDLAAQRARAPVPELTPAPGAHRPARPAGAAAGVARRPRGRDELAEDAAVDAQLHDRTSS